MGARRKRKLCWTIIGHTAGSLHHLQRPLCRRLPASGQTKKSAGVWCWLWRNLLWRVVKQPPRCEQSKRYAGLCLENPSTRGLAWPPMVTLRNQVSAERTRLRQSGASDSPGLGRLRGVPPRLLEPNWVPRTGLLLEPLQWRVWQTGLRSQRTSGGRQAQADPQATPENGRKAGQLRVSIGESKVRAAEKK